MHDGLSIRAKLLEILNSQIDSTARLRSLADFVETTADTGALSTSVLSRHARAHYFCRVGTRKTDLRLWDVLHLTDWQQYPLTIARAGRARIPLEWGY
jgi:hypothetical protein